MKSTLFRIVALVVIFSMLVSPVNAMSPTANAGVPLATTPEKPDGVDPEFQAESAALVSVGVVNEPKGATGPAIYMIRLAGAPLAGYVGDQTGLAATSPTATDRRLDIESKASQSYLKYLHSKRGDFKTQVEKILRRSLDVVYEYAMANNGLAIRMTPEEAALVAKLAGVVFIQRDFEHELNTDNGPAWMGAPSLWDGSNAPAHVGSMGESVVVGIIDTGINYSNPSFSAKGPVDGYDHLNPLGSGVFLGDCSGAPAKYAYCNNKLIGVHGYPDKNSGDPVDTDGHGSHTASTAAGNKVNVVYRPAPGMTYNRTISGVAPHANIIAYAACCTNSALTQAIEDIVIDYGKLLAKDPNVRMSVNYSIGSSSPSPDPWSDFDTVGFLSARAAGIFVADSAGNEGPASSTVGSPPDAPWMTAVGASTHDRMFRNRLINFTGVANPPVNIVGKSISGGYGPASIVYAGDYGNALCDSGTYSAEFFPPNTFSGQIVLCDRGVVGRVEKGQNVKDAGGGGMILMDNAPTSSAYSVNADAHALPAVHIGFSDGMILKAWMATGTKGAHMVTIEGTQLNESPINGDVMAIFSSRGPNRSLPDVITPSLTAPGVDILAAYGTNNAVAYGVISGTSMSSPHVAGAGALMLALHRDWSPAEIQSALMMTADETVLKEDAVTKADPFDVGSGRVDLTKSALAGLVMNESLTGYQNADPASGGDVKILNTASLGNSQCLSTCSWTRTLRNTLGVTAHWTLTTRAVAGLIVTVNPTTLVLGLDESALITVTANVGSLAAGQWFFGEVMLTEDNGLAPDAHLTVSIIPAKGVLPAQINIDTRRNAGSKLVTGFQSLAITDFTVQKFGFAPLALESLTMTVDPTNADPYNKLSEVYVKVFDVPAGTRRLVAQIVSSTAVDVDLYLGTGDTPSSATQTAASATAAATELISVIDPAPGKYWLLVQDWKSTQLPPDTINLGTVLISQDEQNMEVFGPQSVQASEPFDVTVAWDIPELVAGDLYYGVFTLGTDAQNPGNIGTIPVNLTRFEDDVTKTVDKTVAKQGDTLTYAITVKPNVMLDDTQYSISDPLPDGLTYVQGSATGGAVYNAQTNTISWTGVLPAHVRNWTTTTSDLSTSCAVVSSTSDGKFDAYTNLSAFGIPAQTDVTGDSVVYKAYTAGAPFSFYGQDYVGLHFTDDGFGFFGDGGPGDEPWANTGIPDAVKPNNLLAMDWNDYEIVYDLATNKGVTLATAGGTAATSRVLVEFDDLQIYGDSTQTIDMEMQLRRSVSDAANAFEVVYAYDNINLAYPTLSLGTIGIENALGTAGTQFAFNNVTIHNGMAVCFDFVYPSQALTTLTYQAVVNAGINQSNVVNIATHMTNNAFARPAQASATTAIAPNMTSPDLAGPYQPNVNQEFSIVLSNVQGVSYTDVAVNLAITATDADVTSLQFYVPAYTAWYPLPYLVSGDKLVGVYPPVGLKLPLAADQVINGLLRVTFANPGTYPVTLSLVDRSTQIPTQLATLSGAFIVEHRYFMPFVSR